MSNKILFITSRNVYNTCGELRLIKNRASVLSNTYSTKTDFLVFRTKSILKRPQEQIENIGFQLVFFTLPTYFTALRKLQKIALSKIKQNKYDCIICSGDLIQSLVKPIKKHFPNIPVIADLHGTNEELIEFKGKSSLLTLLRRAYFKFSNFINKKYLKQFDGYLCVSNALKESAIRRFGAHPENFFIVPCAIDFHNIDVKRALDDRREIRQKYKIDESEIVFIYSGGVSPWQCIEESVKVYHSVKHCFSQKTRLCLFSGDLKSLQQFKANDVIIDSLSASEVEKTLHIGDYAFMLRNDFATNHVAYPNKFLEYVNAGLTVIATRFVYDVRQQIQDYDLGVIIDINDPNHSDIVTNYRPFMSDTSERNALLKNVCFTTTLQPFVNFIEQQK